MVQEREMQGKTLMQYLKRYKLAFFCFLICVLITSSSVLAIGKAVSYFIDHGIASSDKKVLFDSLVFFLCLIVVMAFATFGRFFLITYYGEKIICDIRRDLFDHLITQSALFFEKNKIGELISKITSDLEILQSVLSSSISIMFRNTLIFIGGIWILISIDGSLTIIVFLIIPVVILPIIFLGKRLKALSRSSQDRIANMSSIMEENLSFVKLIQSFNNEKYVKKLFKNSLDQVVNATKLRVLVRASLTVVVMIVVFLGVAVVLYKGGSLVFEDRITAGEFSEFLFYTILVAGAFGALSEVFGSIQRAKGATSRLFELLNVNINLKDGDKGISEFKKCEFKNVEFRYPSRSENNLEDLNFTIKKGDFVAIVGPSGAGKTTIFEIIQRFYDISRGELLINDSDVTRYKLKDYRSLFTIVNQENAIFSTTVKENLLFADSDLKKSEMISAAKRTMSHNFIEKLPKGYDTFLGAKGVRLSSGEKQRISLTRAVLKDAQILLLDEPTSNLDSENEKLCQDFIEKYKHDKTVIIIAHRLSTIKNADRIIVMDKGKIVEDGRHDDLIKKKGLYKKLVDFQFK